jgi:hypothetical protein
MSVLAAETKRVRVGAFACRSIRAGRGVMCVSVRVLQCARPEVVGCCSRVRAARG